MDVYEIGLTECWDGTYRTVGITECWECRYRWMVKLVEGAWVREDCPECGDNKLKIYDLCPRSVLPVAEDEHL